MSSYAASSARPAPRPGSRHHNVVAVFDTGDDHGTLFLVMEYVPGLTLRDLIRKEAPMSPAKALAMIEPVLSALAAAHDAGILHRDVKPENVLLADDGRVKVADFGLARAINSETQHTATGGILIGTVSYLSPELVVNGKADARADVYAAGVLIYEMLTGHKPHQADSPIQVAYKHVHEDIPPPSASTPGIPPYVDALVARATARDTAFRPADARVLLHQVRRVRQRPRPRRRQRPRPGRRPDPDHPDRRRPHPHRRAAGPDHRAAGARRAHRTTGGTRSTTRSATPASYPAPTDKPPAVRPTPPPRPTALPPRQGDAGRRPRCWPCWQALAGWYFGIARYTSTPGVLNLTEAAARVKLDKAGLDLKVDDQAYSETVRKGFVVSTDPDPGDRVLKNGTVGVVISLGPERHKVPDVRNKTLDDAQQALDESKLEYGDAVQRFDEKIAKGRVITTDPVIGTALRRNAAVDVVVSKGPRPIKIPDFTGKPADPAQAALERRGFKVDTTEVNDDTVPKGRIVTQSPDSGTGQKGDVISLVVSKGPVMVEVPNVVGMGLDAAQDRLEEAGFRVSVRESSMYIGVKYVVSTDPGRGTSAPKGSTVIVSIV